MRVAGLILAAGESARMGRPKATLELDGRSFVELGVATLRAAGCSPVLIVDGAHRLDALDHASVVHNAQWHRGPLSSLQVGLREALAREPRLDAVVVHHVERPRVRAQTVRALLEASRGSPACIWQPCHGGRSGHPLLWPCALFEALLHLDPSHETARALTRGAAASQRRKLEVDDPGVLIDASSDEGMTRARAALADAA